MTPAYYDEAAVTRLLDYPGCIAAMRAAMSALSASGQPQPLRQIVRLEAGGLFGVMPGDLAADAVFGAKLVSVFGDPARPGRTRHQGVVVAYDGATGAVSCITDAEAITRIRTAAATAAATDALARADAQTLLVMGTGTQAVSHVHALVAVRSFTRILLWGRSGAIADQLATTLREQTGLPVEPAHDARAAAGEADVICTVTGAAEPILRGDWVRPGTHVNLVGSSYLGPVEADTALVAKSRYVADYRPSVLAQASELAVARDAGAVTEAHVVGDIGEIFAGRLDGRLDRGDVTVYKSLGHVVQDLAATAYVHRRATALQESAFAA